MNQSFWYRKSLEKIELNNKTRIMGFQQCERYLYLNQIKWDKLIAKSYYESKF